MVLEGYMEWTNVFSKDLSTIWQREREELRIAAVLYEALHNELEKVQSQVEEKITNLKKKLDQMDEVENKHEKRRVSPKSINISCKKSAELKKNVLLDTKTTTIKTPSVLQYFNKENTPVPKDRRKSELESPDLFKHVDIKTDESASDSVNFIDVSFDEEPSVKDSPPLNKLKKPYRRNNSKKSSQDRDTSGEAKKNLFKESVDHDCTPDLTLLNQLQDSDCTFVDGWFTQKETLEEPSNLNLNCGVKKADDYTKPLKKLKMEIPHPEPVIRGNARKLMKGTTCKECVQFYSSMNLPPEKLQKIINECSKHRYLHQPREETMPGFWDLTFPDV